MHTTRQRCRRGKRAYSHKASMQEAASSTVGKSPLQNSLKESFRPQTTLGRLWPVLYCGLRVSYCCARDVVESLIVFTGGAGLPGSFTGAFNLDIISVIARSSCGSLPARTEFGSLSTSMSGSTP